MFICSNFDIARIADHPMAEKSLGGLVHGTTKTERSMAFQVKGVVRSRGGVKPGASPASTNLGCSASTSLIGGAAIGENDEVAVLIA